MKYNRIDKDNNILLIKITTGNNSWNVNTVYCKIYRVINYNLFLFNFNTNTLVRTNYKPICDIMHWTCEEYELWADICLGGYNKELRDDETLSEARNKINNSCN